VVKAIMGFNFLQISIPIVCLAVNVLIQVIGFRYLPKIGLLKSEYLGFIMGLLFMVILEFYLFSGIPILGKDYIASFIVDSLSYILLGYCYFHFVNLGETARRIRILRELYDSMEGLSLEELLMRYNAKEIVDKRIERLSHSGQIILKDKMYYINDPIMLLIARIMLFMKLAIMGRKTNSIGIEQKDR
jgi:hypothetical protein